MFMTLLGFLVLLFSLYIDMMKHSILYRGMHVIVKITSN